MSDAIVSWPFRPWCYKPGPNEVPTEENIRRNVRSLNSQSSWPKTSTPAVSIGLGALGLGLLSAIVGNKFIGACLALLGGIGIGLGKYFGIDLETPEGTAPSPPKPLSPEEVENLAKTALSRDTVEEYNAVVKKLSSVGTEKLCLILSSSKDSAVREGIIAALGDIGDVKALEPLRNLLQKNNLDISTKEDLERAIARIERANPETAREEEPTPALPIPRAASSQVSDSISTSETKPENFTATPPPISTPLEASASPQTSHIQQITPQQKIFLSPLAEPVHLMFTGHTSGEEIKDVFEQIQSVLKNTEPNRPVVLWLERAFPDGAPGTLEEFQEQYNKQNNTNINWFDILLHDPVDLQHLEKLETYFKSLKEKEKPEENYLIGNIMDDFGKGLLEGMKALQDDEWKIITKVEDTSFDAFLTHLRSDAIYKVASEREYFGSPEDALNNLAAKHRYACLSMEARDNPYGAKIANSCKEIPNAIHFVIRGKHHSGPLPNALSKQCVGYKTYILEPKVKTFYAIPYLYIQEGYPNQGTKKEELVLIKELLGKPIDSIAFNRKKHAELSPDILKFVSSLPEDVLESWYQEVFPKRNDNATPIGKKTLAWLSARKDLLPHESLGILEKLIIELT